MRLTQSLPAPVLGEEPPFSEVAPHAVASWHQLMGRLRLFVNFYPTARAAIG